ncbi:OmpA family protein [Actinacidiphila oryziradicis]|uniref:OmpA family protein n=1 Tax=Actinacidiphila oryziradicis TaxID=2571141 RepID=A0A4U0S779_9ACTN|nr:OmpA family protein [Actinacidiphila oryziradicis]TKA03011.1 OmpA family protein [Actinacidiphila oryziradicis]
MPRTGRPGSAAATLALALTLLPVFPVAAARADTVNPTALPTSSAPTKIDPNAPGLKLPAGATLAAPKVLDIVSVTDSSSSSTATASSGEERHQESNSTITYALQADVTFGKDSAKLSPTAAARIKAIASDIATKKVTDPIRVFGFTDNLGSSAHGAVLSKQRADAVYNILATQLAASGSNTAYSFQVRGYGEDYPIADNSTEPGRKQNRRVEITFTPPSAS